MKKLLLVSLSMFLFVGFISANESYKLNDSKVDAMFSSANEASNAMQEMSILSNEISTMTSVSASNETSKAIVATVVCWFVGGFGIHRYVLGTKGSMWAIYTFTVCGIFGIVPTVDFFVLLIDGVILGHGEKYVDNNKFFMWGGK